MNFYQQQALARRKTRRLVIYFVLALILIVLGVNSVAFALAYVGADGQLDLAGWLAQPLWMLLSAAVVLVVVGRSLWTSWVLAGGGQALAKILGARRLTTGTELAVERRFVNVVEEMSIASGVPVPQLYVLDNEAGINAFVAGTRATETVMVVTRGALEQLKRSEIQGVVAHEYSHIFNHDMHLNLRLMGALAGLMVIGQGGRLLMHAGSRSDRNGMPVVIAGMTILALGYIGTFLGALIKAAISREREFLADASAVQYTRDPGGIANALYRIGQHSGAALLAHSRADDVSHFCFAAAVRYSLFGLLATHPPISARIRAIDPHFVPPQDARPIPASDEQDLPDSHEVHLSTTGTARGGLITSSQIASAVGTLDAADLSRGVRDYHELQPLFSDALTSPQGSADLLFALLTQSCTSAHDRFIENLLHRTSSLDALRSAELRRELNRRQYSARTSLVNLALSHLSELDGDERNSLLNVMHELATSELNLSVFERALAFIVCDHLRRDASRAVKLRYRRVHQLRGELRLLLSALSHAGQGRPGGAEQAFAVAWSRIGFSTDELLPATRCRLKDLMSALRQIAALSAPLKETVIQACADCVIDDGLITQQEIELIQIIALSLDCPLPAAVTGHGGPTE